MAQDKVRENKVRRMADRQLLRLEKNRRRDTLAVGYGLYRLVDEYNNPITLHSTLDKIEAILTEPHPDSHRKRVAAFGRPVVVTAPPRALVKSKAPKTKR